MLSQQEYQKTKCQLKNIPKEIHGPHRAHLHQRLKRKIKEHEYATTYDIFEPLPHISYFINRITSEKILNSLIQTAISTTEITIDTESINIPGIDNVPALIQVQMIIQHHRSIVLIIEMHHLPREHDRTFLLIKELIQIIFSPEKTIYIFGEETELLPFTKFQLFTKEQIDSMAPVNLQNEFKRYWQQQHPHTSSNNCICETCIGKLPSNLWSLQDCVAYELNKYLPKIHTNSNFNIGLDPDLFHRNPLELQHRQNLTNYAQSDCLSMEILIKQMRQNKFQFKIYPKKPVQYDILELCAAISIEDLDLFPNIQHEQGHMIQIISEDKSSTNPSVQIRQKNSQFIIPKLDDEFDPISDDDYPSEQQITNQILSRKKLLTPSINILETNNELLLTQNVIMTHTTERSVPLADNESRYPMDWESLTTNEHRPDSSREKEQSSSNNTKLSAEERKRIHNRACTRKQRQRYYRCEIIKRNADRRFTPKKVKIILREHNISFSAVNDNSKWSTSNKISLYIGIKETDKIDEYERIIQNLFTTAHYNSWYRNRRQPNHRTTSNHRTSSNHQTSSDHQQASNDRRRYQHHN